MNDDFDYSADMDKPYPNTEYIINKSAYDRGVEGVKEEIVRCKDCAYSEKTLSGINGYICVRIDDPRCWLSVGAGGFCAWGKRKEKRSDRIYL